MPAYAIASYDIVDSDRYSGYVPAVVPLLQKHNAEVLVADFDAQALEGEARSAYVVLRFPSKEAALDWYNDPEYVGPRNVRITSSANTNLVLVAAFAP